MTTGCGTRLNWSGSPRTSRVTPLKPAWSPSQRITVGLVHGVAQRPDLPRSPASGRRASTRVSTRQARAPAPRSNTDAYENRRGLRGFSGLVVQTGIDATCGKSAIRKGAYGGGFDPRKDSAGR